MRTTSDVYRQLPTTHLLNGSESQYLNNDCTLNFTQSFPRTQQVRQASLYYYSAKEAKEGHLEGFDQFPPNAAYTKVYK